MPGSGDVVVAFVIGILLQLPLPNSIRVFLDALLPPPASWQNVLQSSEFRAFRGANIAVVHSAAPGLPIASHLPLLRLVAAEHAADLVVQLV
eukprot:CAMPEP_0195017620 /NCGR_PEP_ID=MMETSP0326_2-20130528/28014_1 /TAXON_ID=2866 ORGANISM="Crypthecodinium cohnii, Strain Seligo" /NCGR_SAMPLE_ID=MMETSP0326_2 /ASSEMBLY_ACC=CAM_ASM_000348 /LENGTH=91 /DNA_ID=CAMNT_0040034403 /DNA_START=45 /DNA_END=316 /DNA_ORIENTATION=-